MIYIAAKNIAAKTAAKDWTHRFFLVHADEAGRDGAQPGVCVLEVEDFRETACHELGPTVPGERGAEEARLRLAGLVRGAPALTHRLSLLEKAVPAEALPAVQWLEGYQLALLLFPSSVDYSFSHLAGGLIEGEGEALELSGPQGARLYLRLLAHWHAKVEEMDPPLRSQTAALLKEAGDPLAWFFHPRPGRPRPLTFSERAPRRRGRDDRLTHPAGRRVDPSELDRFLQPEGRLQAHDGGFEARPEQRAMAREVLEAFNTDSFLVVEAGTGVGKSMAYLLPAALFSLANEERVVISTHTKNLQDQLCGRDLPRLTLAVPQLRSCRLKGRSNYLCLKRWEEWCGSQLQDARGRGRLGFGGVSPFKAWAAVLLFLDQTGEGDLEELSLEAREQLREFLPAVCSHPEECLGPACPLRERCWVEAARDRAAASHVVVVNHALLLSDAAESQALEEGAPRPVLPAYSRLVVDEAHHLERVATEIFSADLSLVAGLAFIDRLLAGRGLLQRFEALPCGLDEPAFILLHSLREGLGELRERLQEFFVDRLPALPPGAEGEGAGGARGGKPPAGQENRARVTWQVTAAPAWEELERSGEALAGSLETVAGHLAGLAKLAAGLAGREGVPEEERKALESRAFRLAEACAGHASTVREFFLQDPEGEPPSRLRWWETTPRWRYRGSTIPNGRICTVPVEMGPVLSEKLLAPLESAVFTSATLRAGEREDGFAFFSACAGLDGAVREERAVKCVALGSPFDYASQARCLVVTDLPEPRAGEGDAHYLEALGGVVGEALEASRGRGLVLFTSYRVLDRVAQDLFPRLEERGIACLKQERDSSNVQLLGRFREEVGSALFATSSFWEGVDVPGESLSLVVITKLPFAYFGDPLMEGRMEFITVTGRGDGWRDYYLPRAVMQFRQGLGRLIRRAGDRGVMLVLDPRVLNRRYSAPFLGTLPGGLPVLQVSAAEVGRCVGEFLTE